MVGWINAALTVPQPTQGEHGLDCCWGWSFLNEGAFTDGVAIEFVDVATQFVLRLSEICKYGFSQYWQNGAFLVIELQDEHKILLILDLSVDWIIGTVISCSDKIEGSKCTDFEIVVALDFLEASHFSSAWL